MSVVSVEILAQELKNSLEVDVAVRRKAEQALKQLSQQPQYICVLLQLISNPASGLTVQQPAAVAFKNCVKYRWQVVDTSEQIHGEELSEEDKSYVRTNIIAAEIMQTPQVVRAQILESLTVISKADFPTRWPNLLPMLVERMKLDRDDLNRITVVLQVTAAIFRCFVNVDIAKVNDALDYAQKQTQDPLLEIVNKLHKALPGAGSNVNSLRNLLSGIKLVFDIYYCLNWHGMSQTVEDRFGIWVKFLHAYLVYENPLLKETNTEKESIVDAIKALIIESMDIFVQKHEEEFAAISQQFTTAVWKQVESVGPYVGQDNVALSGIKFLTTLCHSVHCQMFKQVENLRELAEKVIIPNFYMRDEELETFEMNYMDYIRKDMEGNDVDTRQRAAADLVKALTERFPEHVTNLFQNYVNELLKQYYSNKEKNWKSKDSAINLVMAYTIQGQRSDTGVSRLNPSVNIGEFFTKEILPELQSNNVNSQSVLKADALKFFTVFRAQFPGQLVQTLFPSLVNLMCAESNVVHSYSAIAITKLLMLKQENNARQNRFEMQNLGGEQQFLKLLNNLFAAFRFPDSSENEYLMQCTMRVIMFLGTRIGPLAIECQKQLVQMLVEVCKNPKQPLFNHYLFESVAAVIKYNPYKVTELEQMMFPPFQQVLQADIQEFLPYVFQIFSQLVCIRGSPLPDTYTSMLPLLMHARYWDGQGSVKALRKLVEAYLVSSPQQVIQINEGKCIVEMLGVFQALHSGHQSDHEGFSLLTAMFLNLDYAVMQRYMGNIWTLIFQRLTSGNNKLLKPKYYASFIAFLFRVFVKLGVEKIFTSMEQVQAGSCVGILGQVIAPNLGSVYKQDYKVVVVGATNCLCEMTPLQNNSQAWCAILSGILQLFDVYGKQVEATNGVNGTQQNGSTEESFEEQMEYSNKFAQLINAHREMSDVAQEIQDGEQYLIKTMAKKALEQQMGAAISGCLTSERQQQLKKLSTLYKNQL